MTEGPGKYDDLCTLVRERAGVTDEGGAVVIIIGGRLGPGFSVQASFEATLALPDILEAVARQIRRGVAG
jgi:hypothetical protein